MRPSGPGGRRVALSLLLALLAVAVLPRPAHAIFGVGGIVYDPTNHSNAVLRYGQLVLQARQAGEQLVVATRQANHAFDQARGFSIGRLRIPSIGQVLGRIDARYAGRDGLGYANGRLDELFRRTFPGLEGWSHRAAGEQARAAREAAFHLLLGARDQHALVVASERRLEELKMDLALAATEREVAQIQNRIAAEQLDQQVLQRGLERGVANLQAVDVALRADQAGRKAMEDSARAAFEAYRQDVHEEARRRVEARRDSIARARLGRRGSRVP